MSNSRISVPEAVSIVLIVLVAHTLVSLPKSLLNVTGSATIINLLYVVSVKKDFSISANI